MGFSCFLRLRTCEPSFNEPDTCLRLSVQRAPFSRINRAARPFVRHSEIENCGFANLALSFILNKGTKSTVGLAMDNMSFRISEHPFFPSIILEPKRENGNEQSKRVTEY